MLQGGPGVYDVEYRMRHEDGRWIWVHDRARVLARGVDGRARQVVGFVVDVTESRAHREALRISEERFRHAAQAVRGVIYDIDCGSEHVTRVGTEALLGLDSATIGERRGDWLALVHPDDVAGLVAARDRGLPPGSIRELEYRARHRDGHWVHVWDHAIVVDAANGPARHIVGLLQDLSERGRERTLLRAHGQLLAGLDRPVALLDAALVLQTSSGAFAARFGAGEGGLAGRPLRELLVADEAQWTRICDEMSAVGESADKTIELSCRHRDGSTFPCQVSLRALSVDGERFLILELPAP
jgi:PAS domain S-box-containing protein